MLLYTLSFNSISFNFVFMIVFHRGVSLDQYYFIKNGIHNLFVVILCGKIKRDLVHAELYRLVKMEYKFYNTSNLQIRTIFVS